MSQQAFCHHFLSEWIDSSHDGRLTPVQKGILGENIVYHLLVGIKDATQLLSTDPVFLGNPIVELQVTGNAPDMLLRGQNHDYLLEVKNWFPRLGQNLNSWNRWGYNLRDYTNFKQDLPHKTWDAAKWRVRTSSGELGGPRCRRPLRFGDESPSLKNRSIVGQKFHPPRFLSDGHCQLHGRGCGG